MRMILQVFPNSTNECQCILFRDGKYSVVTYRSNGRVYKYNLSHSRGYEVLLKVTNSALLEFL